MRFARSQKARNGLSLPIVVNGKPARKSNLTGHDVMPFWKDVSESPPMPEDLCLSSVVVCPQCDATCDLQQKSECSADFHQHAEIHQHQPDQANELSQNSQAAAVTVENCSPRNRKKRKQRSKRHRQRPTSTSLSTCPPEATVTDTGRESTEASEGGASIVVKEVWQCVHCHTVFDRELLQLPQVQLPPPGLVESQPAEEPLQVMMPGTAQPHRRILLTLSSLTNCAPWDTKGPITAIQERD
eukprot:Protomagalhaensia_sp_Gyna_25__1758@NODE_1925_length_1415_cov_4_276890_g1585_i0_p1_GENE_NODE_1925_length_1415_cov_4_276890_g1585_i0NODE_1925_length_1415_cov_4_276890_g1585_i0_p1_ORF_typecomplete_len242_score31_01FAP/PF07174_11/0_053zinc_ribbon_5/PF13719_6/1_4e02zinc_ribbon_5/PF13719_6/1_2_NODE_1925_length_1415_cov_4_276890_g1585_i05721297